jgi:D-alanyl-D-alanine carboxypeptidase
VIHNYNKLLDRYPGADGMKTGFICASGYNLVASATRNGHRLIAIILGAWSGAVRTQQAAELLERGFNSTQLSWLTPSLGTVDQLAPIEAQPANLREEMCGGHRRKPPSEDNEEEPDSADAGATGDATGNGQAFMLSSLKPSGKFVLGPPIDTEPPVVVFTGPADHPDAAPVATAVKTKRKAKHVAKAAPAETQSAETAKPAAHGKTAHAKAAHAKPARTETTKTAAAKKTKPKPAAVAQ